MEAIAAGSLMSGALQHSILLIEDEPLVAMDAEMTLGSAGFRIVGPATSNATALSMLLAEKPDLAVIDLKLGNELVYPLFDYLEQAGTPFIIVTGHSRNMVPEPYRDRPFLQKPYQMSLLLQAVDEILHRLPAAPAQEAS